MTPLLPLLILLLLGGCCVSPYKSGCSFRTDSDRMRYRTAQEKEAAEWQGQVVIPCDANNCGRRPG